MKSMQIRWRRRGLTALLTLLTTLAVGFTGVPTAHAAEPGLTGKRIVIDAGHGGRDGGAQSAGGLIQEKTITLGVALQLADLLRQAGAQVYLTRDHDTDLTLPSDVGRRQQASLRARTRFAKSKHPDAFISIHCNGAPSPAWRGAHVIYQHDNEEGKALAEVMQAAFRDTLLPTHRAVDDASTLYLLKRIPGPAVLAEIGFVTNPEEANALRQKAYQQRVAFAMYVSLLSYFGDAAGDAEETG
ncbi:N-acetylmuramoyl-L-alanine amidase [Alicyclobacillus cycloheptanicus]|uniref:N-acetylmuramoyl-L-alanine amidase n=1 Tax=Alicyclobacillus cycloheptanicus TaxID=1457 RepID=A0ABT9XJG1_9BACL|nr:N-acetylmuramoyl-L-alanine amidase [Alicyclobacillus cycloheptanicus]MDQ0190437.1 N-acetylmuramoyl-L-alanine amidase [Alicyclobacillus cycloheptanicus]WDM02676.1 N-acetylmuramoyl-L-alanine amidase [Alicyclobacillus cycloheptanicus]